MNELELHTTKSITELPKLNMSNNVRIILHSVLKKIWKACKEDKNYKYKYEDYVFLPNNMVLLTKPVTLDASDLKKLFGSSMPIDDILELVFKTSYEASYKTNIDLHGKKRKSLLDTKMSLFTMIQRNDKKKTISFIPSSSLAEYIEVLKNFSKIGIDITEVKKLQGNYSLKAYEFISQNNYRDENNNKLVDDDSRNIKIEYLKKFFEIPENYSISQIDNQVLKPIQKSINKHTKYNIIGFRKLKLDLNNKKRISHYRIDVEYKEEYLKKLKEQQSDNNNLSMSDNLNGYDDIFKEIHS